MATYSGYLLTGIPDNPNADQLLVASGLTSSGAFTLDNTLSYTYPTKTTPYSINESRWYKVAFKQASNSWQTPYSEAIDGAQILKNIPQLAITSTYDGISYSTPQDVYDRANLTIADTPINDVNYAISVARSFIDLRMSTLSVNRYSTFSQNVAQKKFNGLLKLLKDVEINFALSLIYKNLADDALMQKVRNGESTSTSVSVGQTSVAGIKAPGSTEISTYLDALSTRYASYATSLLDTLVPNYVPLRYSENGTGYRQTFISFATDGSATFNFADGIILDRMDL